MEILAHQALINGAYAYSYAGRRVIESHEFLDSLPFIVSSYAIVLAAAAILVAYVIFAERKQNHALAALEAKGIRRRSQAAKQTSNP